MIKSRCHVLLKWSIIVAIVTAAWLVGFISTPIIIVLWIAIALFLGDELTDWRHR